MEGFRFVRSATQPEQYPRHQRPEIALVGRSNVGKSSLINTLSGRRGEAKVSKTPGRTQTLNFYEGSEGVWLVDLPGYGYAEVPGRVRRTFGPMIETYLARRPNLAGVLHLLDARHGPTSLDMVMREYIIAHAIPSVAVATKWDKLKRSVWERRKKEIEGALGAAVIPFSSLSGMGRDEVRRVIAAWGKDYSPRRIENG